MESELPILLYLFSFALAAAALVPACPRFGPQQCLQTHPCRRFIQKR